MSGQLVGEVIAAADELRARGVSERGFHALIAIAEKAYTDTRRASVPLRHICAVLYGDMETKQRTAERAIHDLKKAGVITVKRRGYNNGHGGMAAPIYEIQPLTAPDTGDGNAGTDTDTGDGNAGNVSDKQGGRSRQDGDRSRHSFVVLNGGSNGSSNGGAARAADSAADSDNEPPPRYCPKHPNDTTEKCPACKRVRENWEEWHSKRERRAAVAADALKRQRQNCTTCEGTGLVDAKDDDDAVARCPDCSSWPQEARS